MLLRSLVQPLELAAIAELGPDRIRVRDLAAPALPPDQRHCSRSPPALTYRDRIKRTLGGSQVSFRIRRAEHGPVGLEQREILQGATYNRSFTCR